jgi:APA family basic amino acid/polyamine antiporter
MNTSNGGAPHSSTQLRRPLGTFDATMLAVGIVIGAGIFKAPSLVAGITGSFSMMILAWILGAVLSFVGALVYAELASAYPSAGGDYTFLTRAYGKRLSFLFAWARSTVIVTGSIALIGFILGDHLTRLLPLGPYSSAIYAAIAVMLLTLFNLVGLKTSARLQNALTVLEIAGVLLVAAAGMWIRGSLELPEETVGASSAGAFGLAMVFVLLTYGGWNEAAYVSAELRGGSRSILRALTGAIAIIAFVYIALVLAAVWGMGFEAFAASSAFGVDLMTKAFGPLGGHLIAAIVAIAALTSMNATMIVGARSNFAVGNDWRLLKFLSGWRDERNVPTSGYMLQAVITIGLIALGAVERDGFVTMVEFTAPVFWFFFLLSGVALFVLRRKHPHVARPFNVPLYPLTPLVFIATCAYLLYSSITYAQSQNAGLVAVSVTAIGVVVLAIAEWRERRDVVPD